MLALFTGGGGAHPALDEEVGEAVVIGGDLVELADEFGLFLDGFLALLEELDHVVAIFALGGVDLGHLDGVDFLEDGLGRAVLGAGDREGGGQAAEGGERQGGVEELGRSNHRGLLDKKWGPRRGGKPVGLARTRGGE